MSDAPVLSAAVPGQTAPFDVGFRRFLRWVVGLGLLAILASTAGTVVSAWRGMPASPGQWYGLEDDAYYYLVTAKHAVRGDGMTFDGFAPTNGFHPLWMMVTMAVVRIVGLERSLHVQAAAYAAAAMLPLLVAAALCARQVLSPPASDDPRSLAFLGVLLALALPETGYVCMVGLESGLLVCLLVLTLQGYVFERPAWLRVLLPLVFLTRIDSPLWLAPLILHETWRAGTWRKRAALILPLAAVMAATGAYNAITTGGVLPIHAVLTSTFPVPSPRWYLVTARLAQGLRTFTFANLCSLPVVAGIATWLWVRSRRASRPEGATWVLMFILAGTISLLLLLFFRKWAKPPSVWHFTPAMVLLGAAIVPLALRSLQRVVPSLTGPLALAVAVVATGVSARNFRRSFTFDMASTHSLIRALRDATPGPGRIAATDCGYLAFWLDREIVNLDGLMNDRAYQRRLRDGKLDDYLGRAGVSYVLAVAVDARDPPPVEPMYRMIGENAPVVRATGDYAYSFFVYSYLYETYSNTITFHRADEALRFPLNSGTHVFLFRWPRANAGTVSH